MRCPYKWRRGFITQLDYWLRRLAECLMDWLTRPVWLLTHLIIDTVTGWRTHLCVYQLGNWLLARINRGSEWLNWWMDWLFLWLTLCMTNWLIVYWFIDAWFTDWLIDWLFGVLSDCLWVSQFIFAALRVDSIKPLIELLKTTLTDL